MVDQCSNCYWGQRFQTLDPAVGPVRVCQRRAPKSVTMVAGAPYALGQPVPDDYYCGDGADNTTKRNYDAPTVQASPALKPPAVQFIPALIAINGNATMTVPAGYAIREIFIMETAGATITGGLNVGTTAGGTDLLNGVAVGPTTNAIFTPAVRWLDTLLSVIVYIQAATAWNGAQINIAFSLDKANPEL
jgi:hypothetical protein